LLYGEFAKQIYDVFVDGFGFPQTCMRWNLVEAEKMLRRASVFGLLVDKSIDNPTAEGYSCYTVIDDFENESLIWGEGTCLKKSLQKSRWGRIALDQVLTVFSRSGRNIRWIGGRTQNPNVMRRYRRFGSLFPFAHNYVSGTGTRLCRLLIERVSEAMAMEPSTGIVRRAYTRRLGDYLVDFNDPEIAAWERYLDERRFDRENGDAVVVVAQIGLLKQSDGKVRIRTDK
jgi:hypothetical protein